MRQQHSRWHHHQCSIIHQPTSCSLTPFAGYTLSFTHSQHSKCKTVFGAESVQVESALRSSFVELLTFGAVSYWAQVWIPSATTSTKYRTWTLQPLAPSIGLGRYIELYRSVFFIIMSSSIRHVCSFCWKDGVATGWRFSNLMARWPPCHLIMKRTVDGKTLQWHRN